MTDEKQFKVYGYRWVMLAVFMLVAGMNQLAWITFAPMTTASARFFHTSELAIGLLSMVFMVVYVVVVIPAAWAIDTWGIKDGGRTRRGDDGRVRARPGHCSRATSRRSSPARRDSPWPSR